MGTQADKTTYEVMRMTFLRFLREDAFRRDVIPVNSIRRGRTKSLPLTGRDFTLLLEYDLSTLFAVVDCILSKVSTLNT